MWLQEISKYTRGVHYISLSAAIDQHLLNLNVQMSHWGIGIEMQLLIQEVQGRPKTAFLTGSPGSQSYLSRKTALKSKVLDGREA